MFRKVLTGWSSDETEKTLLTKLWEVNVFEIVPKNQVRPQHPYCCWGQNSLSTDGRIHICKDQGENRVEVFLHLIHFGNLNNLGGT